MSEREEFRRVTSNLRDVAFIWLFGDVAYTVLPIATIATINLALNQSFENFSLIPEWSFASIVFFGLTIRHLIELKTRHQQDRSHRLDTGTQFLVLLLIASVLTLSLVVLREKGLNINRNFLINLQSTLFWSGLILLFMVILAKYEIISKRINLPKSLSKKRYYSYIETSFDSILENIDYLKYALDKSKDIELVSGSSYQKSKVWDETRHHQLEAKLRQIEQSLPDLKAAYIEMQKVYLTTEPITDEVVTGGSLNSV